VLASLHRIISIQQPNDNNKDNLRLNFKDGLPKNGTQQKEQQIIAGGLFL
jgi:hypothetical protein